MNGSVAKFRTIFTAKTPPVHEKNAELLEWCKKFAEQGLAPRYGKGSSHGNLSFRAKNGMIITRSGSDLSSINETELVEVTDCDEKKFSVKASGMFEPSSESFEHLAIYRSRKEINAVFHGHSNEILLHAKKFGIVETRNEADYGTVENLNEVIGVLGKNDFVVMKGHGFLCLGKSLSDCGKRALEFQKKAEKMGQQT
ncbi:MAG: class II aldolase/adducin family protein [archaeon]